VYLSDVRRGRNGIKTSEKDSPVILLDGLRADRGGVDRLVGVKQVGRKGRGQKKKVIVEKRRAGTAIIAQKERRVDGRHRWGEGRE